MSAFFKGYDHDTKLLGTMTDQLAAQLMWEQRLGTESYLYGTEPNDFLKSNLAKLPMGETLCLAEGEGRNSVFLASTGRQVSSVDLTEAGVAKTLRLAAERGVIVNAQQANLATYELGSDRWDAIVSIFAHTPVPIRIDLHRRVAVALRTGGVFILEAYTPNQIGRGTGGPPSADLMMTAKELRKELAVLEILHIEEIEREVNEGTGHSGIGAVVQVIAQKG